jgi:hypothetical protein
MKALANVGKEWRLMKKIRTNLFLGILIYSCALLMVMSCGSNGNNNQPAGNAPVVYVAGFAASGAEDLVNVPVYWKGNQLIELSRIDSSCDGYAHNITVASGKVYVAGDTLQCSTDGATRIATAAYWKDGARVDLPKPAGYASDPSVAFQIAVSNGSVYVAGFATGVDDMTVPVYWKDGQIVSLAMPSDAQNGVAYNIFINGADIYVTGVVLFDGFYPVLWKNGVAQILPRPYEFRGTEDAYPMTMDGDDVRVFGNIRNQHSQDWGTLPRLVSWKNGEVFPLYPLESAETGLAYDGTMDGGVEYRAGIEFEGMLYTPTLWNGDTEYSLPMIDENLFGMARAVFVESGSVYVAGVSFVEDSGNLGFILEKPCYWVDGMRVDLPTLSPGSAFAYDIFVAR